jgi:hypothetical protein
MSDEQAIRLIGLAFLCLAVHMYLCGVLASIVCSYVLAFADRRCVSFRAVFLRALTCRYVDGDSDNGGDTKEESAHKEVV